MASTYPFFLEQKNIILTSLKNNETLTSIYENLKFAKKGMSYRQFCRYVEKIRDKKIKKEVIANESENTNESFVMEFTNSLDETKADVEKVYNLLLEYIEKNNLDFYLFSMNEILNKSRQQFISEVFRQQQEIKKELSSLYNISLIILIFVVLSIPVTVIFLSLILR